MMSSEPTTFAAAGGTSSGNTLPGPVSAAQRIDFLDALRGFALIGILLMNIEWFNRPWAGAGSIDYDLQGVDYAAGLFVNIFVQGRFYPLFALLFGIGFALMLDRAIERGQPFAAVYLRRMLALALFGVLHGMYLWYGDILLAYSIGGLLLLGWVWLLHRRWFKRFDNPTSILRFSLGYLLLPFFLMTVMGTVYLMSHDTTELRASWEERSAIVDQSKAIHEKAKAEGIDLAAGDREAGADEAKNGDEPAAGKSDAERIADKARQRAIVLAEMAAADEAEDAAWPAPHFAEVQAQRGKDWRTFVSYIPFQVLISTLPLFMLGSWLVRSGRVRNAASHRGFYRALMCVGIGAGLPMVLGSVAVNAHPAAFSVRMLDVTYMSLLHLGQTLMAAGYLGLIVTMVLSTAWRRPLMWLAPMGRMALTNYLMQSLILSLVFHGYALGQYGNIPRAQQMLLSAAILAFQCVFSALWLKTFRFGPMEWLWRCFTYWQWQPMWRGRTHAVATGTFKAET